MVNANQENNVVQEGYITFEQMNTIIAFQNLWNDLAEWMRFFLVSLLGDLGSLQATITRMYVKVPLDFYNALQVFYGPQLAQQFLNLLSSFIVAAWRLAEAMKAGDSKAADTGTVQLYQIADKISTFLASINVYWAQTQWRTLFNQFIRLWVEGLQAFLTQNFEQGISLYDRSKDLTVAMGDYMARGIIARQLTSKELPQA